MQVNIFLSKEATGTSNLRCLICTLLFTNQTVSSLLALRPCYQYPLGHCPKNYNIYLYFSLYQASLVHIVNSF